MNTVLEITVRELWIVHFLNLSPASEKELISEYNRTPLYVTDEYHYT